MGALPRRRGISSSRYSATASARAVDEKPTRGSNAGDDRNRPNVELPPISSKCDHERRLSGLAEVVENVVANKTEGICSLTGERGPFVKSHIILRAFMQPLVPGQPMIYWSGLARRPLRRWDGLYDRRLVTRAGEDILEAYDTWAVQEFRKHHLIWSSWGPSLVVPQPHYVSRPSMGVRVFDDIDPAGLRLFFASLLWRAAASQLDELSHIILADHELARLAESLCTGRPLDDDFYPVTLSQFSTMGDVHHETPGARQKRIFDNEGNHIGETPIYRFYFDGLIAHFHRPVRDRPRMPLGISGVGNNSRLCVHTIPFEQSAQRLDLAHSVTRSIAAWPKDAAKLSKLPTAKKSK